MFMLVVLGVLPPLVGFGLLPLFPVLVGTLSASMLLVSAVAGVVLVVRVMVAIEATVVLPVPARLTGPLVVLIMIIGRGHASLLLALILARSIPAVLSTGGCSIRLLR